MKLRSHLPYRVKFNGHWCRYFRSIRQAEKFARRAGGLIQSHNPFALPECIETDEFGQWVTI